MAGRTFSFVLFLLRKKYYLQIKRCHKPENACGTLSLKTTVEPFYLLSCEAKTNSKQWECKQWQYITRSPWKVAQDCLVCSDGGALALVVSLALMMEGKHIIHIKKMYIFIIYAWERWWIFKHPMSRWPSPRNLTSWNSPFSFISDGSFGRRRSRARSLIRPGFTRFLWKMHQKNKNNQSLTFLEKSTTLSIVVKKNLAGKTLNQPSGDQLLISKKSPKKKEEEKDF